MDRLEVSINPGRVVDAISHIGYEPSAAIMDIVDNSVTAGARNVVIDLVIEDGVQVNRKNNVVAYRVLDDGVGMDRAEVLNALRLGSNANYGENSLSKYGMGLKSAGFSLGDKLCVLSKRAGEESPVVAYVDKELIRTEGYYVYLPKEDDDSPLDNNLLGDQQSGTVVEIQNTAIPHEAASTTIKKLSEKLGVAYHGFLARVEDPISIKIRYLDEERLVTPSDILFRDLAKSPFVADDYDYISPYTTHEDYELELEDAPDADPIKISIAMFPAAKMAQYPGLSEEEQRKIRSYKVSRENRGFFIYRNGRLIRWGDPIPDGKGGLLVGRDDINLRCTLSFETQHDEALHVDVSKQRLNLPVQVIEAIEEQLTFPKDYASQIRRLCHEKLKAEGGGEGQAFNDRNADLAEEDSQEHFEVPDREKEKVRIKELSEASMELKKVIEEELGGKPEADDEELLPPKKIQYSEKIASQNLWEVGLDPKWGVFVVLNKNHPYYGTVVRKLGEAAGERQAIEALFWSLAAAERIVRTKMNVDSTTLKEVFDRFKLEVGYNVTHWARKNHDLFD